MAGARPIVEIMTINFTLVAFDMIVNHAAKIHFMSGGQVDIPLILRTVTGSGRQLGAQHSQNIEGHYAMVPGLKVVAPATPADAKGMLLAAYDDKNPVFFAEHFDLYSTKGEVPEEPVRVPLGKAAIARKGSDITLIGYSRMTLICLQAAEIAGGAADFRGSHRPAHPAPARYGNAARFRAKNAPCRVSRGSGQRYQYRR